MCTLPIRTPPSGGRLSAAWRSQVLPQKEKSPEKQTHGFGLNGVSQRDRRGLGSRKVRALESSSSRMLSSPAPLF